MSIFGKILGKIFGSGRAEATTASSSSAPASSARPAAPVAGGSAGAAAAPARAPMSQVDVAAVLDDLAGKSKQKLDWRHSIVDLMKLLDLDSGLGARKELAQELGYRGDTSDSATMNIWLHKQVMVKLAENGGRVPDELRS
ncbi:MAG TPA: DUF3597 domain-containing protein [Candidatus Binatia bacterium]